MPTRRSGSTSRPVSSLTSRMTVSPMVSPISMAPSGWTRAGCRFCGAALVQVGERPGRVAVADGAAHCPVVAVALADDVGEVGVAADGLVDLVVPAAGTDGLGLLGVA